MARQWQTMEKSFAAFVLTAGVLLLLLASTIVQDSSYGGMTGRVAQMSQIVQRKGRQLDPRTSTTGKPINVMNSKHVTHPLTDPQWMTLPARLVQPFVTNRSHPFLRDYVIRNEFLCGYGPLDLLIVIHSSVQNFHARRILRETWAATNIVRGVRVRRVFFLGRSDSDVIQGHVNMEQATYTDIVQGDFMDTFPNLTMKAITALRWVNDHCSNARYILKADDDMFVNIFSLLEHTLNHLAGSERTVLCHAKAANTSQIVRDPKSKWYVPRDVLPGRTHWPAFCSGYVVVITTDSVSPLYSASYVAPYVPVDDGFVYGILPEVSGKNFLQYHDISSNFTLNEKVLLAQYETSHQPITKLAGIARDAKTQTRLWLAVLQRLSPWARSRAAITSLRRSMGHAERL
ncbi:hypothetical protein BaRGS_00012230 [Batillaria attramentaria]|uniref:Hexosyltransferase n=1 Tax=Batillaria attramentaria TaxID=370345 RepID=A0ABD0LBH7_9CAEN